MTRPSRGAFPRRRLLGLAAAAGVALSPALVAGTSLALPGLAVPATDMGGPVSYPHTTWLAEPAEDPGDAALRLGLTAYHDLSRRLNALQSTSDRVSAEVLATTAGGREVVMVTLTAPESQAQTQQQRRMRDRLVNQPAQASGDRGLARSYKLPVFVNANIHGNEWEGTDAALRFVEEWATSEDPAVQEALESVRVHLVVSMNPDGRVTNSRRNTAGFDLNRDFVTASQPEVVGVRDALIRAQPALMVDLHGYVNGTLVEPTTPPHGENYEYDLFVKHAFPNALGIEQAILDLGLDPEEDGVRPPQIPLRDWAEGWDDWPPIFTPQYAAFHGAVSHTVEVPLRVNNSSYGLPEQELRRRAAINTDIAHAAITSTVGYAVEHRAALLADQIEVFRRGVTGEPQTPVEQGLFGVIGPEDVYLTDYPRAYVIPVDGAQRSAPAAARLVDHLVANDVEVTRLTRPATLAGTPYPVGTYVVDLHQAKRGMANTILAAGTDISSRVDAMYDISGWSHALLWGADVVSVPEGQQVKVVGETVTAAGASGALEPSSTGWTLRLDDPADVRALGRLLSSGAALEWLDDGSVLVPADAASAAATVVADEGVRLTAAPAGAVGTAMPTTAIGVSAAPEEQWALREMGLTFQTVSTSALNDGLDLDGLDALYVSSGLRWRDLDADAQAELEAFVADGGGIVAKGRDGAALNDALGMLEVSTVAGRSDANGVVAVENTGGPLTARAPEHTFVYSPLWFTELGPQVVVDQRYAADPVVSGHWRPSGQGGDGPESAAGQPVVVSGTSADTGARTVLMGSEPLFRAHPKGQYATVARALIWAALED